MGWPKNSALPPPWPGPTSLPVPAAWRGTLKPEEVSRKEEPGRIFPSTIAKPAKKQEWK